MGGPAGRGAFVVVDDRACVNECPSVPADSTHYLHPGHRLCDVGVSRCRIECHASHATGDYYGIRNRAGYLGLAGTQLSDGLHHGSSEGSCHCDAVTVATFSIRLRYNDSPRTVGGGRSGFGVCAGSGTA